MGASVWMPLCLPAAACAEDLGIDDLVPVQHDDPVHGPHKLDVTVTPAHATRDRHGQQRGLDNVADELGHGLARFPGRVHEPLALVGGNPAELADVDAAFLRERRCRRFRVAVVVERDGHGRPFHLDFTIGLALGEVVDSQGQATRARKRHHAIERQALLIEPGLHATGERIDQGGQRLRRQLFGADLDEQVRHATCSLSPAATIGKPSASRLA